MQTLENQLDKAMIKFNETQAIRKIYDQILKQLQEERRTFDSQLENFEKTLKAKKLDSFELEAISKDASHSKDVAKTELARIETRLTEERRIREKEIQRRKELIKQKKQLDEKTERKVPITHLSNDFINLLTNTIATLAARRATFDGRGSQREAERGEGEKIG